MGKFKSFVKRVAYAVGANLISLIVSFLTTLVVPKFFGNDVAQYGYLQVYLFYIGYVGFFHFGWCDGIYLRDGGKHYDDLDKPLYSAQFWLLIVVQLIISTVIAMFGVAFSNTDEYKFIWLAVAINIVIELPKTMLLYFLQTTNRIKEYASVTTINRFVYGISIVMIVLILPIDYKYFVFSDVISKILGLMIAIWFCKDVVFSKPCGLKIATNEAIENISVGIKLMFANIASMLITGIVRWGIQTQWDVATYGKISLTLSVSNLLLSFISAVSLVLYPTLRRCDEESLKKIYRKMKDLLMIPLMGCLILYYPAELILSLWLPQYAESLEYMAILFPMCLYAAKSTMLIQTYMNVFRLEKKMLMVNLIGVVFASITTIISVFIFENLTLAIVGIVMNQMFRTICSEIALIPYIHGDIIKDILLEVLMSIIFILSNWFLGGWTGVLVYVSFYIVYLLLKRKEIVEFFNVASGIIKKVR